MATAVRLSPAAALLRTSRLFSLPPPLPTPQPAASSDQVVWSETATSTFPTRQAIETTILGLARGDWGLKRPLPKKSMSRKPKIRLNDGIDTIEHITDFESASDLALNLLKFQELEMPLTLPRLRKERQYAHFTNSVFDPKIDNTSKLSEEKASTKGLGRWRYDGPWLAGLSRSEFESYLRTEIGKRKEDFADSVRKQLDRRRVTFLRDEGREVSAAEPFTKEQINDYIRSLRHNRREFGNLIATFLDLPEGPSSDKSSLAVDNPWEYGRETVAASSYAQFGPPSTHPSAGLSYTQSRAHSRNDAELGFQKPIHNAGVQGRILRPDRRAGMESKSSVGLAGFVASTSENGLQRMTGPNSYGRRTTGRTMNTGMQKLAGEPAIIRPEQACINPDGSVYLAVQAWIGSVKPQNSQPEQETESWGAKATRAEPLSGFGSKAPQFDTAYQRNQGTQRQPTTSSTRKPLSETSGILESMGEEY